MIASVNIKKIDVGADGYGLEFLILCLLLQFMENLSNHLFERILAENLVGKWFRGFGINEKTSNYSSFCKFLEKIGCKRISLIFEEVKRQLAQKGYDKLNNDNLLKFSADKDARIDSKSKKKFWFGCKKHVSARSGMINKVSVTKADVPDAEGMKPFVQEIERF